MRTQGANMGSSPPSSNEATHFGTPSTNLTAMSPEACGSAIRSGTTPQFGLRVNTHSAIAAHRASAFNNLHLSPTAEEFTPRSTTFNIHGRTTSPVRKLVASSMPDPRINTPSTVHGPIGQASTITVVRNIDSQLQLSQSLRVVWETFSNDENVTRTFQILDKNNIPSLYHILNQFPVRFDSLACIDNKHIENGIIRLSFHDDRDAKQAYVLAASMTHTHCELAQLTAKDVALAHGKDPNTVSNYDGQLLVSVMYHSRSVMPTVKQFHGKLAVFGAVKSIVSIHSMVMNALTFRIEYNNVQQAHLAMKYLYQASDNNVRYLVTAYEPDVFDHAPAAFQPTPEVQTSLTGRSTVPPRDFARLENVMARVMRENPSSSRGFARTGHNVIDIGRIEAGLDVRTTIMLRNIPNKVDQTTLKNLLDVTSFGEFDFMYLRIDFANNCNVGYAFINFVDPLAIISFARARAGKRWNIFSSDKVAEISYATIQGRDCLVQKFRNSSVMLEDPSYRPKLYYTRPSSHAGQEEDFAEPDNYSKMRRSLDNAEHIGLYPRGNKQQAIAPANVRTSGPDSSTRSHSPTLQSWSSSTTSSSTNTGLFAPREGQAHREEQRRRRSQFDRGTPGAEIELSSYRLTDEAFDRLNDSRLADVLNGLNL